MNEMQQAKDERIEWIVFGMMLASPDPEAAAIITEGWRGLPSYRLEQLLKAIAAKDWAAANAAASEVLGDPAFEHARTSDTAMVRLGTLLRRRSRLADASMRRIDPEAARERQIASDDAQEALDGMLAERSKARRARLEPAA